MYYDSDANIAMNEAIFAAEGLRGAINVVPLRPFPMATFYLNYLLGGMAPEYFRIVNVALLATAACLVALLVNILLGLSGSRSKVKTEEKWGLSILMGALFLVHPLQMFTTLYIWQRSALMSCLFSYASLAAYLAVRSGIIGSKWLGYGLWVSFLALALVSKENSVSMIVAFLLSEIFFFRSSWKELLLRSSLYILLLLVLLAPLSLLQHPHGLSELEPGIFPTIAFYYRQAGVSFTEVILTQCRVVFSYLLTVVAPTLSRVQLINPQVFSRGLLTPWTTAPALAGIVGLVLAAAWMNSRRPLAAFGILFFFTGLIPEAILVPQYPFFGYRPIFSMLGLLLILADICLSVLQAIGSDRLRRVWGAAIAVALVLSIAAVSSVTLKKAEMWRDPIAFWEAIVSQFDPKQKDLEKFSASQALNNLGDVYMRLGSPADAVRYFEKAVEMNPDSSIGYHNLGAAYKRSGRPDVAVEYYRKALELNPHSWKTRKALESIQQEMPEALAHH
jgi:protein O-mannosyl-transferase